MKKILFLLVVMAIAIAASAQRTLVVHTPEQVHYSVFIPCADTACVIDSVKFSELSFEHTEARLFLSNGMHIVYVIPMLFDTVLDLHMNQKWVIWKHGYISHRQFCKYKRKYNKVRSNC